MSTIALHSTLNISETVTDKRIGSNWDHQYEMAYEGINYQNGHVTNDVK